MTRDQEQAQLFELAEAELAAARARPEHVDLARELRRDLRLGGMSWSYAGWKGLVYGEDLTARQLTPKHLADRGLTAYAKHALLRAVEIDRSYYEPLPADVFARLARQVAHDFRFVVKAHEDCVVLRFPPHARYGKKAGQRNPRYLDPLYAAEAVVAPLAGLDSKLGALLFQFPPQPVDPAAFARDLRDFLDRLPRGPCYAVELRNPELLTPDYAAALADSGAVHCHNVWTNMPPVMAQARKIPPAARRPLILRWLLRAGDTYEGASKRSIPFDRLVDEDPQNRSEVARLVAKAGEHDVPTLVLVDNKAEGCAPESIVRLARAIVEQSRK